MESEEIEALRKQVDELQRERESMRAALAEEHRRELDRLREEMHRELARKAFALARAERNTTDIAETFETSISWRLTAPLRAITALARRLRGGGPPRQ